MNTVPQYATKADKRRAQRQRRKARDKQKMQQQAAPAPKPAPKHKAGPVKAPALVSASKGVTSVSHLAKSVVLPGNCEPCRPPTTPPNKTAVFPLVSTGTFSVGGVSQALLIRNPAFPLWIDHFLPPALHSQPWYAYRNYRLGTVSSGALVPEFGNSRFSRINFSGLPEVVGDTLTATPFPEEGNTRTKTIPPYRDMNYWPLGTDKNSDSWFYIPDGFTLYAVASFSDVTSPFDKYPALVSAVFSIWTGGDPEFVSVDFRDMGGNHMNWENNLPTAKGVYARLVRLSWTASGTQTAAPEFSITVNLGAKCSGVTKVLLPAFTPPEINVTTHPYMATRCIASSVLFTNVSPMLQMEGTVKAARLPVKEFDTFSLAVEDISSIRPSEMRFASLKKGCYGFTTSDPLSEDFRDCVFKNDSGFTEGILRLDAFEYASHFYFSDLDSSASTTLAYQANWTVEFLSVSSLFTLGVSTSSLDEWYEVQKNLLKIPFFYENPSHISALMAWAAKIAHVLGPAFRRIGNAAWDAGIGQARRELAMAM